MDGCGWIDRFIDCWLPRFLKYDTHHFFISCVKGSNPCCSGLQNELKILKVWWPLCAGTDSCTGLSSTYNPIIQILQGRRRSPKARAKQNCPGYSSCGDVLNSPLASFPIAVPLGLTASHRVARSLLV